MKARPVGRLGTTTGSPTVPTETEPTGTLPAERASTPALLVGGSNHMSSPPAPTVATPTETSAAVVDHVVATSTASAGASMNVSSVHTESSANAVRCSSGGTSTASDCRTTEKTGTMNRPARAAAPTSASKVRKGAAVQMAASMRTEGSSARRSPSRSTRRPRHGAPIAIPRVAAAATIPAAA